jgi:hypothetical protein
LGIVEQLNIMGRKAKLKKARQQQQNKSSNSQYDSTQFVRQFERLGYRLKTQPPQERDDKATSPQIPQDKVEPQL